ncbi:hypothetical protein M5K25_005993 [Dendrobium thyrsiflorum]|uniref:Uncharacterized protein n=1 Tax=Dendrobium thyrsiflorum TaxID=117978 RepID=A0ABD0VAC8_DENTH
MHDLHLKQMMGGSDEGLDQDHMVPSSQLYKKFDIDALSMHVILPNDLHWPSAIRKATASAATVSAFGEDDEDGTSTFGAFSTLSSAFPVDFLFLMKRPEAAVSKLLSLSTLSCLTVKLSCLAVKHGGRESAAKPAARPGQAYRNTSQYGPFDRLTFALTIDSDKQLISSFNHPGQGMNDYERFSCTCVLMSSWRELETPLLLAETSYNPKTVNVHSNDDCQGSKARKFDSTRKFEADVAPRNEDMKGLKWEFTPEWYWLGKQRTRTRKMETKMEMDM